MASFGRKPVKGAAKSSASKSSTGGGLKRLLEEEAERERFAQEFEDRQVEEKKLEAEAAARAAEEKRILAAAGPNPIVFLDIEVRSPGGQRQARGRVEIELWADSVPKTAENFRCLCTGEKGKDLHFKGNLFHRVIPGFMAQGGDITRGDGTGGLSIYGKHFEDEKFVKLHAKAGLLSMANAGPNSNNSQFFILFKSAPHLDFKHVVFGELLREEDGILKHVEQAGSESGNVTGAILIADCGEVKPEVDDKTGKKHKS